MCSLLIQSFHGELIERQLIHMMLMSILTCMDLSRSFGSTIKILELRKIFCLWLEECWCGSEYSLCWNLCLSLVSWWEFSKRCLNLSLCSFVVWFWRSSSLLLLVNCFYKTLISFEILMMQLLYLFLQLLETIMLIKFLITTPLRIQMLTDRELDRLI